LLDLFGRAPHQFVFRGAQGADIVLFAVAVALVPPVVLWLVQLPVGLAWLPARRAMHLGTLALLAWAVAVQAGRPLASGATLMVLAAAVGIGFAALYRRAWAVRAWLRLLALAPVAFVALFLLASPTARLMGGDRASAFAGEVESPVPVVVVVFDELPLASLVTTSGEIDRELFPSFARLVDRSHWFRNATTVHTTTWHAVPAIVSGRMPRAGTSPFAWDHPDNLFTALGATHETNVVESVTRLCPTDLCEPVGERRRLVGDAVDVIGARLSWSGPSGDPVAGFVEQVVRDEADPEVDEEPELARFERFEAFLEGVVDDSLTLHYLHILLPHQPLRHVASGMEYDGPDPDIGRLGDTWDEQDWPARLGRQRHLLQLVHTDTLLGQLLDRLEEVGLFDEALVIVTADHGMGFTPGGPVRLVERQPVDVRAAAEIMWVPLLVKVPGQDEPVVSDANVLTVDLLPTVADVLGMQLPGPIDGRSVFGPERTGGKPLLSGTVSQFGHSLGHETWVDGRAGLREVLALGVDELLPALGDPDRLWKLGPSSELVGSPAEDLDLADATLVDVPREVDPSSGVVPSLVRAYVEGAQPGDAFAVAVNGTVGATATSFEEDGRTAVAAMVSDALFRAGPNDITIHPIAAG
jgi:hypothetical protein